jgi:hypothetical protein
MLSLIPVTRLLKPDHVRGMKTPTGTDDRRAVTTPIIEERRAVVGSGRRIAPRMTTLKGAQIVWAAGASVTCIVRNLSETGANIEVHSQVPPTFDLVFDTDQSRRSCCVVWRKATRVGVKFQ